MDFPGKSTEVGCHSLFQRISLIQGPNPHLLFCGGLYRWVSRKALEPPAVVHSAPSRVKWTSLLSAAFHFFLCIPLFALSSKLQAPFFLSFFPLLKLDLRKIID